MARFIRSNRKAAAEMAMIPTRRPGFAKGFIVPVSRWHKDVFTLGPSEG